RAAAGDGSGVTWQTAGTSRRSGDSVRVRLPGRERSSELRPNRILETIACARRRRPTRFAHARALRACGARVRCTHVRTGEAVLVLDSHSLNSYQSGVTHNLLLSIRTTRESNSAPAVGGIFFARRSGARAAGSYP